MCYQMHLPSCMRPEWVMAAAGFFSLRDQYPAPTQQPSAGPCGVLLPSLKHEQRRRHPLGEGLFPPSSFSFHHGGSATICLTLVSRRKNTTALVALSSLDIKATLCVLERFHSQWVPMLLLGLALHKEVVARLSLVAATPPTPVWRQTMHLAQVVTCEP